MASTSTDAAHLSAYAAVCREAGFARGLLWGWLDLSDDPEARERLRRVTGEFLITRRDDDEADKARA